MAKFAALQLAFCGATTNIVRRNIGARSKERHMSLIEDREVQQFYDEIMRRMEPAFHL